MSKTKLWAIVDDGEMMGDSEFGMESRVEYKKGMTLKDIRRVYSETDACKNYETEVSHILVAWVIDQKTMDAIDNSRGLTYGNDSAVYAANAMLKSLVAGLAVKTIGKTKSQELYDEVTDWCATCGHEHDYMGGPCEKCGGNTFTKEKPCPS